MRRLPNIIHHFLVYDLLFQVSVIFFSIAICHLTCWSVHPLICCFFMLFAEFGALEGQNDFIMLELKPFIEYSE